MVASQAPLSMGFVRQEYWSLWPCPPPEVLPDPGTEPVSCLLYLQAGSLPLAPPGKPIRIFRTKNKDRIGVQSAPALQFYISRFKQDFYVKQWFVV